MAFLRAPQDFIQDMMMSNCQRPFYIYVLTAIPAFVEAWILVRFFDLNDLIRARGSYLARKGASPGRNIRHSRTKRGKAFPTKPGNRVYNQGLKHLLALTQPLENIGWALLLIGAVDTFYARWMMYLDDADACLSPDFFGPLIRRQTDGVAHPNNAGNGFFMPELISDPGNWGSTPGGASMPVGRFRIVCGITIIGPNNGADYELELRVSGALGSGVFTSGTAHAGPNGPTSLICEATVLLPLVTGGAVQWILKGPSVPVGLEVPQADVMIMRLQSASDIV